MMKTTGAVGLKNPIAKILFTSIHFAFYELHFKIKLFFLPSSFFSLSLSQCKILSQHTLEKWIHVLSIYTICLWMLRAFLWLVKTNFYFGIMTEYSSLRRRGTEWFFWNCILFVYKIYWTYVFLFFL